jgi:hypothetical protein
MSSEGPAVFVVDDDPPLREALAWTRVTREGARSRTPLPLLDHEPVAEQDGSPRHGESG